MPVSGGMASAEDQFVIYSFFVKAVKPKRNLEYIACFMLHMAVIYHVLV